MTFNNIIDIKHFNTKIFKLIIKDSSQIQVSETSECFDSIATCYTESVNRRLYKVEFVSNKIIKRRKNER